MITKRDKKGRIAALHDLSWLPEYQAWKAMRHRCNNPGCVKFKDYGGRGIRIWKRWDNFVIFLRDVGFRPSKKHSLDRKNNNGNYTPENCRWATKQQQSRNRRFNVLITYKGETKTVAEWAENIKIKADTLHARLKRGWDHKRTIETPI